VCVCFCTGLNRWVFGFSGSATALMLSLSPVEVMLNDDINCTCNNWIPIRALLATEGLLLQFSEVVSADIIADSSLNLVSDLN
jgi:hypothetical protein